MFNEDHLPGLRSDHLKQLRESGLNDDTIRASRIYTENDHYRLASLLGRNSWPRAWGGGLVIPYIDDRGEVVQSRVKPDRPPVRDGKSLKYLQPTNQGSRLYVPPGIWPALDNSAQELLITEGEKKALSATQFGFPCVGLAGVDCWHPKKSSALIADLERINWQGRPVYIVFDSDAVDNPNVAANESLLAVQLQRRGARVKVARIPALEAVA